MTIATILAALAAATAPVSTEVSVPGPEGANRAPETIHHPYGRLGLRSRVVHGT